MRILEQQQDRRPRGGIFNMRHQRFKRLLFPMLRRQIGERTLVRNANEIGEPCAPVVSGG